MTDKTRHLIDKAKVEKMKEGTILINIARGAIVDIHALTSALPKLGGVVLDVFEEEPFNEDNPLWDMENVIITPHNSFAGEGNDRRLDGVIMENLTCI